jgi:4'-phosphopantetheinyl transferase
MLSEALGHLPGCLSADRWQFSAGKHGKPELVTGQIDCDLRFNLSHTKGMVAVAIAIGADVGIDVEATDRHMSDDMAIADAYFSSGEKIYLHAHEDPLQRRHAFLGLWTAKEAFIKAVGLGLSMPLDSFCVDMRQGCYMPHSLPAQASDRSWTLKQWDLSTHLVSLAIGSHPGLGPPRVDYQQALCMP